MSNELREAAEERRRLIAETRRELESEYEEIVRECDNADGVYKEETCL